MAEIKKRMAMGLGFTLHMQSIDDESNVVMQENFVNNWGGRYERLEIEEAILFENALRAGCKAEFTALMEKGMEVASAFGLELVGETAKPGKPQR